MKFPESMPPLTIYKRLVQKKYNDLLIDYFQWLQLLFPRGVNKKHISEQSFNLLYKAISKNWSTTRILGRLQEIFIKENLSLSLLLEPLNGFEWLSKNRYPLEFTGSSPILLQIVAPFARLIAALNNQHPPFYQPFSNLICIYVSLYLLNTPTVEKILTESRITLDRDNLLTSLPLLQQEAQQIIPLTYGIRFKLIVAFYLGLSRVLLNRQQKNITEKINFLVYVNAFLYGLWYILTVKGKPVKINQI